MENLQELTGQESGFIIFDDGEVILCNWSSYDGIPRMFGDGLVSLNEKIPEVEGIHENLSKYFEYVKITVMVDCDNEELPEMGTVYKINDIIVIAPDNWA